MLSVQRSLSCVQVQHILGSCFASRCVVWDLRKNDPIIKVSDSTSRVRCKVLQWHPDVATQLCIASEDDHTPVIQVERKLVPTSRQVVIYWFSRRYGILD